MKQIVVFICLVFMLTTSIVAQQSPPKTIDGVSPNELAPPPPPQKKPAKPKKKSERGTAPRMHIIGPGGVPGGVPGGTFTPPREAPIQWTTFTAPDASFSILLPSTPQPHTQMIDSPAGKIPMQMHISMHGVTGYAVGFADLPNIIDSPDYAKTALAAARDRIASLANAKVLKDQAVSYDQFPGQETKFETPTVTVLSRIYYINNRYYQIQILVPAGMGDPESYSQKYFDSFKVLKITGNNLVAESDIKKAISPPADFFSKPVAWREQTFTEAGFKALLPREPFRSSVALNPSDKRAVEHVFISKGEHIFCLVSYRDFLSDVDSPELRGVIFAGTKSLIEQSFREVLMKINAESDYTFQSFRGKEYKIESAPGLAKLSGLCRTILVGRRVFTWMTIFPETEAGQQEVLKFLDSFQLAGTPPSLKITRPPPPPVPGSSLGGNPVPKLMRVSGGVLQANAIKKVTPQIPPLVQGHVKGAVLVAITVSEDGKVENAEVVAGHPLLRETCLQAAKQWTFKPTLIGNHPVKVQGVLTFNFTQ